ncbi:hypothetical protein K010075C41_05560 [Sellimonas intestinalis]
MCRKIKNFLFHPVFSSLNLSLYERKNKIPFLFVKHPLYVLIYEEQITFALKESGLIQEQRKNEKGKEKLHEQNNLNGKTDKRSGGEISPE